MEEYFSAGKLILMGEYAVLHGADALCLPLKTGQKLQVSPTSEDRIKWSWIYGETHLSDFSLDCRTLEILDVSAGEAKWGVSLIKTIREQDPVFLQKGADLKFVNYFPPQWGLGSSSATISSLCRMARVNPYIVNQLLLGGSGADIACTQALGWFLYRSQMPWPGIWSIPLAYHFRENTFFVYSGKKQSTATHLATVAEKTNRHAVSWMQANDYVYRFLAAPTLPEMMKIIYDHELLISEAIGIPSISHQFRDFPGKIKSLGAWGGDFFMVLSLQDEQFVRDYFLDRGYNSIYSWDELVEREQF